MTGLEPAITVHDLGQAYETSAGRITVLDRVTCTVLAGQIVAVMGPSGAGKSTLLCVLGGLEPPQSGSVTVVGRDLRLLSSDQLAAYRRETVGFVFQDFALLGQLTALENVELALTLGRVRRGRRDRAKELLAAVGLAHRFDHRPHALSGGENQRVAIARALANSPELILADEPTGNLDAGSTGAILDLLTGLPRDHGCTLVIVTHDPVVAARADRVLLLADGRIAA